MTPGNAAVWSRPDAVDFFTKARSTTSDVYPSEWFFLKDRLREGIRILDVGCAQGGFAGIIAEHLTRFEYTGVDISSTMIARARERFPQHRFHVVEEGDDSALAGAEFDLVLVLGILHLHESWRRTLDAAWRRTRSTLIFDLRETHLPTVEDKARSWFTMQLPEGGAPSAHLPYIILNTTDALDTVIRTCAGATAIARYGYLHPVSGTARTPISQVMATAYRVERSP